MLIRQPACYSRFRCLAGDCPDTCCQEWDVEIDDAAAARYAVIPGELGRRIRGSMYEEEGRRFFSFARDGKCPLQLENGLCGIQTQLGEEALCQVCRTYPRISHDFGDFMELGLELSCPEAARLILEEGTRSFLTRSEPGGQGDYDREAMEVLLKAREKTLDILADPRISPRDGLVQMLLWGHLAQQWLDEGEEPEFDPEQAMALGRQLAEPGGGPELRQFFLDLEILTDRWRKRLEEPSCHPGTWEEGFRNLAIYFVQRYYLQAVADYDLLSRVKLAAAACVLLHELGGSLPETAQLFSKEIENDAENIDAILDGAYDSPALTDARLLGLLLEPPAERG